MQIRDRIRELRRVKAADLRPNPRNWRSHPLQQQDALRAILAEVGYANALLARELEDGTLMLIDGHLRAETTPDVFVPVLVLDVDEAESDKILLTLDPLAGMAAIDEVPLRKLIAEVEFETTAFGDLLGLLTKQADAAEQVVHSNSTEAEGELREVFQVVVECRDEADQRAVFERMRGEGYRCRVLML